MTREIEWDDYEREKMLGLAQFEAKVCECGFHESVADEDPDLELAVRVCPVCSGLARHMRKMAAADDAARKALGAKPDPEARHPGDGRHVRLRPKAAPASSTTA